MLELISNRAKYSALIFLGFSFLIAFFPQLISLTRFWFNNEDYSHAFLIIPVSLWLTWEKKEKISTATCKSSIFGLYIVILSLTVYLAAYFAEILTMASFSIILSVWGTVIYLYGFTIAKIVAFPLIFLLFMIPVPGQIYSSTTLPLQLMVTKASVPLISTMGIPVYREGNVLQIPGMTLQVVNACSGLRSIISLLTISALLGYLSLNFNSFRFLLFAAGIPIAVLVNIFRVATMTVITSFSSLDILHGPLHTMLGLTVFILAFLLLYITGRVLSWLEKKIPVKS